MDHSSFYVPITLKKSPAVQQLFIYILVFVTVSLPSHTQTVLHHYQLLAKYLIRRIDEYD